MITPLNAENQENEVLVPSKGLLRLIVKNMACAAEVLGSVSFDLSILKNEGFQWLPLSFNMSKDQIFELPEEVEKNKLLILINPNKKEIAETVEQTNNALLSELQEYLQKEKSRHELEVTRIEKQYKGYVETLTIELEKNRKTVKKYKLIH